MADTKVTVRSGQTLSSIAKANGTTVSAILKANPVLKTNPKYNNGNKNSKGKVETKAIAANPNQMQALAYQGFPMFPMFPNPYQYGGNSDMKGNGSG